ncbi:phage gp6-like head-tail connector protein [Chengkuizengella axinellae]|uniref:Phage gp6-like head-tail connector protein n=1 Tax=Chengkuizengella axinellae TaxID=3064388 RepID=A0ABT9J003_9BACL|nr:phage gp6-like head-tail connector protein [Chengkuizengella sp. 2205SS18-9]MDP5274349.1 phage gp6-like head-tail connector protein [Chengkuizengella sp. 2205SS18-9]
MLASIERLKKILMIPESDISQDEELSILLSAASEIIEKRCSRKFKLQEHNEKHSGSDWDHLFTKNYPITNVEYVKLDEEEVNDYDLINEEGILFRESCWPKGQRNIEIKYNAGYADNIPKSLEQACLFQAKVLYTEEWGKASERIGNQYSVTFMQGDTNDLPPVVLALIGPYIGRAVR